MSKTSPKPTVEKWWLTRDKAGYDIYYGPEPARPENGAVYYAPDGGEVCEQSMNTGLTQRLFGISLRVGQCCEIESGSLKLKAPARRK